MKEQKGLLTCRFCGKELEYICSPLSEWRAVEMAGWAGFVLNAKEGNTEGLACAACRKLLEGHAFRKAAIEVGNSAGVIVGRDVIGKDVLVFVGGEAIEDSD
jgi:hypothetical protein